MGLFGNSLGREFVILGKPKASHSLGVSVSIKHEPSLSTYTPSKRRRVILVVPDGKNVAFYDPKSEVFTDTDLGCVIARSMPLAIYDHRTYTRPVLQSEFYRFLFSTTNELKTTVDVLKRRDVPHLDGELGQVVTNLIHHYTVFKNKKRKPVEDTLKRKSLYFFNDNVDNKIQEKKMRVKKHANITA